MHHGIDVCDLIAVFLHQSDGISQENEAFGVKPSFLSVREVCADIAESQSAKDRVRYRVRQCIGVRVPFGSKVGFDLDATQNERSVRYKPVNITTKSYSVHRS
jgi:hypothetical protein